MKKYLLLALVLFVSTLTFPAMRACAASVTVSWNTTHETIDGFGAAAACSATNITDAQADLFFSTTSGIGLSLVRARVPTDGTVEGCVTMLKAVQRGAKAWATPWSPPASMKTNGSLSNGGSLLTASYQAYANYLATYV